MNRLLNETLSKFFGIANGGRGQNKLRVRAIKTGDTFESADDIGNMRAKYAAIGVHLIYDDEAQVGEEVTPVGMTRKDARVKHIRIGQYNPCVSANGRAVFLRGVAIINGRWHV